MKNYHITKRFFVLTLALCLTVGLGLSAMTASQAQNKNNNDLSMAQPGQPDADMQTVLDALQTLNPKPIETLSPAEARRQPLASDAAQVVLKQHGKNPMPSLGVEAMSASIPGPDGNTIPARIYTPKRLGLFNINKPLPVIVYYHGGGWVIADMDKYDSSARALAAGANAIVVSMDYRLAPEDPFPAQHRDAFASYEWVLANAPQFNGDASRVAVVGESAGGNLAANVSIMARDKQIQKPVAEIVIYPVTGTDTNTPSYKANANAKPLNKPMMEWFFKNTLQNPSNYQDPRINLLIADLHGLPPTTVITAELDPLQADGIQFAEKLKADGNDVTLKNFTGVTHEFFGMGLVVNKAKLAEGLAALKLRQAFSQSKH